MSKVSKRLFVTFIGEQHSFLAVNPDKTLYITQIHVKLGKIKKLGDKK
jgi:hypothetical protein